MAKIGFNVLAWSAVVSEDLNPIADRLKKIGYDGVECFVGAAEDPAAYLAFGKHAADLGLEMTAVTVMSPETNPISESAEVREKALDRIKWSIDRAHDLGATILCGPFHSAHAHFAKRPAQDEEYAWSAEVLHAAGIHAAQAEVTLALEALNRFECYLCNTAEQLSRLVKMAGHPNVRAMFDTHHANVEEKSYPGAIQTLAPILAHVHISENDRGTPGGSHLPWDLIFRTLAEIGYDKWLTIEAFSRNDPDFANSIGVWREYNEPWDIAEQGFTFIQSMCEKHGL